MKKSLICFIVIILFLYSFPIRGQIIRCGTPSPTQLIASNALYKISGSLSIPVVFHVVYSGVDNVTDAQLSSQITALNNAYLPYQISFYLSVTTRTNNSA